MPKLQNHIANLLKTIVLLLCFSMMSFGGMGQKNLVPNYSFEQYINCPSSANLAPPPPWYEPTNKGAGYANACSTDPFTSVPNNFGGGGAYQYPKTGNGYLALFYVNGYLSNQRNYVQVKLTDSLKKGKSYYVECYVNKEEGCQYGCNNIGMLITKTAVKVDIANFPYGVLPANPQIVNYGNPVIADTMSWVKVSGIFKAQGGEQYLTLGNFKYDTQTIFKAFQPSGYYGAGYLLDDVSVMPLDSMCLKADAGKDTAITLGDSVFIGSYTNGIDSLKWQIQNTNTTIDSTRPGFWVKPTTSTFYILQQTVNGCFSADTVVVNVGTVPLRMINYKLLMINEPSLRGTKQSVENLWTTANEVNVSHFNIQRSTNGKDFINIGKVAAQNKNSNEYTFYDSPPVEGLGVVYYRIESIDFDGKKQYTEIRNVELGIRNEGISIYPNPAKSTVNIDCKLGNIKQVDIIDMLGKTVFSKTFYNTSNAAINTAALQKGLFLIKLVTDKNTVATQKLIIE